MPLKTKVAHFFEDSCSSVAPDPPTEHFKWQYSDMSGGWLDYDSQTQTVFIVVSRLIDSHTSDP